MPTRVSLRQRMKGEYQQQFLSRWISSFLVTAVVATVTIIAPIIQSITPASAQIINAQAIGNVISYRVQVNDPDATLTPDTLLLSITNPIDQTVLPIELGETTGLFEMRYPSMVYTLAVRASRGFGSETLASQVIQPLNTGLAGIIHRYHLDEIIDPNQAMMLRYRVHVLVHDPNNTISGYELRWGTVNASEYQMNPSIQPYAWSTIPFQTSLDPLWIEPVYNENQVVMMKLIAIANDLSETLLDEDRIFTPLRIYSSAYITDVTSTSAMVSVYSDHQLPVTVEYTLELHQDTVVIATEKFTPTPSTEEQHYEGLQFTFDGLDPYTEYKLVLFVDYTEPVTSELIHRELSHETFSTAPQYSIAVQVETTTSTIEALLTIHDPNLIIGEVNWYMYEPIDDFYYYLGGDIFYVEPPNGPQRMYTASIPLPNVGTTYYIVFIAHKTIDEDVYYSEVYRSEPVTS